MRKKKIKDRKPIEVTPIYAMQGYCFGVLCYRGFAPLSILSRISLPDEYHPINNPLGTQRELRVKHAKDAYNYAKKNKNSIALWPEIILNVRDKKVLTIVTKAPTKGPKDEDLSFVKIQIDWDKINEAKKKNKTVIARVDGNHRLYYAGGEMRKNFDALDDVYSPFCIMEGITTDQEKIIFRTINAEQSRLNITHLLRIETETTPDAELWSKNKTLWIVNRLTHDTDSPFFGQVYTGGKKGKGEVYDITQKGIFDGVNQLLKEFTSHDIIKSSDKLLPIIKNYFSAIKEIWGIEWSNNKNYKLKTNTGLQAVGIVGGKILNNIFNSPIKDFKIERLKEQIITIRNEYKDFWKSDNEQFMKGKSGRAGAVKIAEDIYEILSQPSEEDIMF